MSAALPIPVIQLLQVLTACPGVRPLDAYLLYMLIALVAVIAVVTVLALPRLPYNVRRKCRR